MAWFAFWAVVAACMLMPGGVATVFLLVTMGVPLWLLLIVLHAIWQAFRRLH